MNSKIYYVRMYQIICCFIAFVYMYQDVVFREIISYILQDIYSSCCNYSNDEKEEAMQSLLIRITGDNFAKKVFILYKI